MDSNVCVDPRIVASPVNRSRSNSGHTSTPHFEGLNIQNITSTNQQSRISSENSDAYPTSNFLYHKTNSVPQNPTIFSHISESNSAANWSTFPPSSEEPIGTVPLLKLGPAQAFSGHQNQPNNQIVNRSNTYSMGMNSTMGIHHYDSQFDGYHTWPQFELHDQLFSVPSPEILFEEPELLSSSMCSRSPSSSPPQARNSVEARDLKRRRDQIRRETKSCIRRARSASNNSNHYSISQGTSPDLFQKTDYATSVTPSPLLSQCSVQTSPTLSSTPFLSPYSPHLNSQLPNDIYGQPFNIIPNDFTTTMAYPMSYNGQVETSIPNYIERPHSLPLSSIPDHLGMYCPQPAGPSLGQSESNDPVRVVHSRPKPQCWEHGCNGRQFSTFSNLLRHQREKSGAAQKSSCPHCGAEFTRTTARNGHLAHDKCKQRRSS
ncbi:unnamed protein product [Blumeria hordei]|uniref:Uncharacterized protein n=1 Tax=Blumeria hordei TaxID=2867405 RepID=A0A383UIN0_BLUHO|nr:unnamed protein product [Blumeria hordei]